MHFLIQRRPELKQLLPCQSNRGVRSRQRLRRAGKKVERRKKQRREELPLPLGEGIDILRESRMLNPAAIYATHSEDLSPFSLWECTGRRVGDEGLGRGSLVRS